MRTENVMRWQDVNTEKSESSAGLFVRWEDGDVLELIPMGEIARRQTHWTGQRMETCTGPGCEWCAAGVRQGVKFLVNVYDKAADSVRIWEMGWMVFKDVKEELEDADFPDFPILKIKRRGKSKDTTYKVKYLGHVDDEDEADRLTFLTQHDLDKYSKPQTKSEDGASKPAADDLEDVPF